MSSAFSTTTAAIVQLSSSGALGSMLNQLKSREVDTFQSVFFITRAHAVGSERSSHEEDIHSGKRANIRGKLEVTRSFDLITHAYLVVDLPGICSAATADNTQVTAMTGAADSPFYTNHVANALIRKAHLSMGGHAVASLTGVQQVVHEELAGKSGKRLTAMVGAAAGGDIADLKRRSSRAQRLYVPLNFFFSASRFGPSAALSVISNQFQKICVDLELNSLVSVIENHGADTAVQGAISTVAGKKTFVCDPVSTAPQSEPIRDGSPVSVNNLVELSSSYNGGARCTLDVTGITLNESDRTAMAVKDRLILIAETFQHSFEGTNAIASNTLTSLDLTESMKNLLFEIQIAARAHEDGAGNARGPMAFDGELDASNGLVSGPLTTIDLRISGQQRTTADLEADFYNMITPYQSHSLLPSMTGVYSLPFAMYPEELLVSSSANVSKLDSLTLRFRTATLQGANKVDVHVIGHAYNILVQSKGMSARYFV